MKSIFICLLTFISFQGIAIVDDSKNIEHQIRICDQDSAIIQSFNLENADRKNFSIYYIENNNHDYETLKFSIRIREKSDKLEITVKKKVEYNEIKNYSKSDSICELDLHGTIKEYSCKINNDVNTDKLEKVLKNKMNWTELLSKNQLELLKNNNVVFKNANIYGVLNNQRFQWNDAQFGLVTVDLVKQKNHEENTFNEISIRYNESKINTTGNAFNAFVKNSKVVLCKNQLDWSLNKFDILEILN